MKDRKERDKLYRQNNREQIRYRGRSHSQKWRQTHSEQVKLYKSSPEAMFSMTKHIAKKKNYELGLNVEQFKNIISQTCKYCGGFSVGKNWCGLDRVDSSKGYTLDNVVPCCEMCNKMKLNHTQQEFLDQCKKIVQHNKKYLDK